MKVFLTVALFSVSAIQDYFDYVDKLQEKFAVNLPIQKFTSKTENITTCIYITLYNYMYICKYIHKTEYSLEVLTPETRKWFESTEKK